MDKHPKVYNFKQIYCYRLWLINVIVILLFIIVCIFFLNSSGSVSCGSFIFFSRISQSPHGCADSRFYFPIKCLFDFTKPQFEFCSSRKICIAYTSEDYLNDAFYVVGVNFVWKMSKDHLKFCGKCFIRLTFFCLYL